MSLASVLAEGIDMRLSILLVCALSVGSLNAQSSRTSTGDDNVLTTVRIPTAVKAGGTLLPAASYQLRLTGEHPAPGGEQREVQEWVEFISNGKVVARELAEILYDDDRPAVGASAQKARTGTRVEMLKDREFLRVSIKRDNERYLIYLPVSGG
jgi:hypothetical protein